MTDYVKIFINNSHAHKLEDKQQLEFKSEVSEKTGVISNKKVAEYHFCRITIYDSGSIYFSGSLHKMHNSLNKEYAPNYSKEDNYKGFNGNIFTLDEILETRTHLCKLFDCSPSDLIFQNIEFGVNTTPDFCPRLFLKGLLMHKGSAFQYRFKGDYAQAMHNRFIIKIYNKSIQYRMPKNVLRFEIKIIKSEELKQIGIRTFEDISIEALRDAEKMLLRRLDEVLYYDYTMDKTKLCDREKALLDNYSNPRYWLHELKSIRRDRHKKRLQVLIENNSDNLKKIIRQEIKGKCVIINRPIQKSNCVMINTSSIELPITHLHLNKCPITGLSLEHENQGSKYIKTSTLKHLFNNDQETFRSIKNYLLENTRINQPKYEKDLIKHLAKQVRNKFYNQNKIKKNGYHKSNYPDQLELSI